MKTGNLKSGRRQLQAATGPFTMVQRLTYHWRLFYNIASKRTRLSEPLVIGLFTFIPRKLAYCDEKIRGKKT